MCSVLQEEPRRPQLARHTMQPRPERPSGPRPRLPGQAGLLGCCYCLINQASAPELSPALQAFLPCSCHLMAVGLMLVGPALDPGATRKHRKRVSPGGTGGPGV